MERLDVGLFEGICGLSAASAGGVEDSGVSTCGEFV